MYIMDFVGFISTSHPTESYEIPEVFRGGKTSIFPFPAQWAATGSRCTTPLQMKAYPADKGQPAIADMKEAITTIHGTA